MTGPRAIIRRAVSFIFDPVPRVDRRSIGEQILDYKTPVDDGGRQARFYERLIRRGWLGAAWLDPVEWPTLDEVAARHPLSSPARLRPYDWEVEHSWPVEGWVLS